MYEIVEVLDGMQILKRTDNDGVVYWIPMNEDNADYQAYLASKKTKK